MVDHKIFFIHVHVVNFACKSLFLEKVSMCTLYVMNTQFFKALESSLFYAYLSDKSRKSCGAIQLQWHLFFGITKALNNGWTKRFQSENLSFFKAIVCTKQFNTNQEHELLLAFRLAPRWKR